MRLASGPNPGTGSPLAAAAEADGVTVEQQNAQLRVVADELGHRMKNLLTIIQSLARQTMHQSTTKDDFEAVLGPAESFRALTRSSHRQQLARG